MNIFNFRNLQLEFKMLIQNFYKINIYFKIKMSSKNNKIKTLIVSIVLIHFGVKISQLFTVAVIV